MRHGQKLCLTGYDACDVVPTNQDFCQQLRSTEFSRQWGLSVQQSGGQKTLLHALSHGHGYAVSDGSYKDERGAAAWIIEGSTSALRLIGQIYTPGHSTDHSSFCSKLTGIVGILYTLTFWPPTLIKPTFRLTCNGLSIINRLSNVKPIKPTKPHADLLIAAHNLISTSMYEIKLVFVRGHQDNGIPTVLTRDAWLNVEADWLAKQKLTTPHTGPAFYSLPGNHWSCYVSSNQAAPSPAT